MKNKSVFRIPVPPDVTIAQFGRVRLMQNRAGKHYVAGGSHMERSIVKNWCQRLAPFLNFTKPSDDEQVLTE